MRDERAIYAFMDVVEDIAPRMWSEWVSAKASKKSGLQKWSVVSKAKLLRVWNSYAKYGFVRNEADIDDIASEIVTNVAKIYINTILMGHAAEDPIERLTHQWSELSAEEAEEMLDGFEEFAIDKDSGQWRISDMIDKLVDYALDIIQAESPEDKLVAVDKTLNFAHQRSDMASWLVQGGKYTLNELSARPSEKNPRRRK